jgi:hypothetical protein
MDYSFFDDGLQKRFTDRLDELGLPWEVFADPIDGWQIRISAPRKVARVISIPLSKHLEIYLVPHSETRDAHPERT